MNTLEEVQGAFNRSLRKMSLDANSQINSLQKRLKDINTVREKAKITVRIWVSRRRRGDEIWKGIWQTDIYEMSRVSRRVVDTTALNCLIARCAKVFRKKYPSHAEAKFKISLSLSVKQRIDVPYHIGRQFDREVHGLELIYHDPAKTIYA